MTSTTEQGGTERLYGDQMPMASEYGEITAAEDVLTWLVVEKIGAPDDVSYTPHQAQKIIEGKLDELRRLEDRASPPQPVGGEVGKLKKLPTAFIVRCPDRNPDLIFSEVIAAHVAEVNGVDYAGLYERDGTPLNFESPLLKEAEEALNALLELYVELVNSGDCGFWDPENNPVVKQSRAILTKLKTLNKEPSS